MPIYEFRCRACETTFEAIRPIGDTGESLECPACGAARPDKLLSVFATSVSSGASTGGCGSGGFS